MTQGESKDRNGGQTIKRRDFLFVVTGMAGVLGTASAAWLSFLKTSSVAEVPAVPASAG